MLEFFIALFGVPILLVKTACEYRNYKKRDNEICNNALTYSNNLTTWLQDVLDIEYEDELKEYYRKNGGYKQLWEDATEIISPYIAWYRLREYPPPGTPLIPTLCYMIIMSYNRGTLPERVAKRGIPTINFDCSKDKTSDRIIFSQTMWWVEEQLNKHGVNDRIVISVDRTNNRYLTPYNKNTPNKGTFKWERMIHPAITINDNY